MRRLNKFNNYTSELSPLLLADDLPFVATGDITPTISADSMITNHPIKILVSDLVPDSERDAQPRPRPRTAHSFGG